MMIVMTVLIMVMMMIVLLNGDGDDHDSDDGVDDNDDGVDDGDDGADNGDDGVFNGDRDDGGDGTDADNIVTVNIKMIPPDFFRPSISNFIVIKMKLVGFRSPTMTTSFDVNWITSSLLIYSKSIM